jgi:hypothetical protein
LAGLALATALLATSAPAAADPPRPLDLRVAGGDSWHADPGFALAWTAPAATTPPLAATHYRLRDPDGDTVAAGRLGWIGSGIDPLTVPGPPGVYTAEVWFEDDAGREGPHATVALRFDDTKPETVTPGPVPAWIGRAFLPLRVRIAHPAEPLPPSGIRGYAVAVDRDAGGSPCIAPDRCSAAETTLSGGVGNDEQRIATLPEGTSYLHAVAVSGAGMRSVTGGRATLRVDTVAPLTLLSGASPGWTSRSVLLTANAADAGAGMERIGEGPAPFTAIRVDDGVPATADGATVATAVIGEGAHRVAYYARDAAGNVDDGAEPNPPPPTAWVRIDRTPPSLAFANSQGPDDPDLIRARIGDRLSGPSLERGWIGVRPAGSNDRFERLPAAPSAPGELRARWHSDAVPTGRYEFRAVGYDAAGNRAVTERRATGEPMVLANPLKTTTRLSVRFNRRGSERTVRYGRRLLLRGRLTAGLGSPLEGRPIRVVELFSSGARAARRVSILRSGPGGVFELRTSRGPSRTITVAFDGDRILGRSAARTLSLRVRGRVRLRTSAHLARVGGRPLVFHGRVVGAVPAEGKSVELQFRLAGTPWSAFRTLRTDRRGRFRYAYRFSDDDSRGAKFQFRAYVPPQQNWPYEPAGSRPILVRGY